MHFWVYLAIVVVVEIAVLVKSFPGDDVGGEQAESDAIVTMLLAGVFLASDVGAVIFWIVKHW